MFDVMDFKGLKSLMFDWYKAKKGSNSENPKVIIEYQPETDSEKECIKVAITENGGWTKLKTYFADGEIEQDFYRT